MQATAIEFRLRMAINSVIIILGFWAPWIEGWNFGRRSPVIELLALQLSRFGIGSFSAGTTALLIIALVLALIAALLRISGAAWLSPGVVNSINMVAGRVMADGPYRYVRNPLYIGLWCMVAALAFLMPATGAIFSLVLITVFMIRLTLGEEAFLSTQLGEPYEAYLRAVPRFIPRLRGAPTSSGATPQWLRACVAELIPIGTVVGIIVYARNYDLALAGRIILIGFGASVIVRAFLPGSVLSSAPQK
ncbi:methyltransferase family protein [Occallatibacter savannae]|uniref:methyltransferase family protein n=1 Tax=Occallatibacter savannae TaxID=1002691 RepID=UPI000D690AF9|nr:isoprenylcysteine carboxylmethyltransferase family protein [Occallatibacter savannae]